MIAASSPEFAAAISSNSETHARTLSGVAKAAAGGRGAKTLPAEQTRECGVHAVHGVTDSHRRERVPVVTAADAQEPLPLRLS